MSRKPVDKTRSESASTVSPHHWSRQEPDGLSELERVDPETGEIVHYRGHYWFTRSENAVAPSWRVLRPQPRHWPGTSTHHNGKPEEDNRA